MQILAVVITQHFLPVVKMLRNAEHQCSIATNIPTANHMLMFNRLTKLKINPQHLKSFNKDFPDCLGKEVQNACCVNHACDLTSACRKHTISGQIGAS